MADKEQNPTSEADAVTRTMAAIMEQGMGIQWYSGDRNDKDSDGEALSNEQVLYWLAGKHFRSDDDDPAHKGPRRPLFPNDEEIKEMANRYLTAVEKQLDKIGQTSKKGEELDPEKQARAGAASGLRAAAKYQAEAMATKLIRGITTDGSAAERVSQNDDGRYQRARQEKYGVAGNHPYVASGQLAQALLDGNMRLIVTREAVKSLVGSAKEAGAIK